MYARRIGERELTFDFADGLLRDDLLLVDRETNSVWSQLDGKAVIGPLKETPMTVVPSLQTTWKFWKARHPETRVMTFPEIEGDPYYYRSRPPGKPALRPDTEHDLSALGFGIVLGREALWISFEDLERRASPISLVLGGENVRLFYEKDALTAWDEDGNLLPGVLAYKKGWLGFHPDSKGPP